MKVSVQLLTSSLVEVTLTPSLLERLLLRERTESPIATRTRGGWCWDFSGRLVPPHIERAIDRELAAHRLHVKRGIAPG